MSEESDALLHIADDHPCCKPTLLWAHNRLLELERENAALLEDKARLDWLDVNPMDRMGNVEYYWSNHGDISTIRGAIDAARNGVQP